VRLCRYSGRLQAALRTHYSPELCGLNCRGQQFPHAHEVIGSGREGEDPAHLENASRPSAWWQSAQETCHDLLRDHVSIGMTVYESAFMQETCHDLLRDHDQMGIMTV